ncbi:alpha/beta hydrolase [Bradyrhizobium sp. U87765 SZCCT0131]|uniref:alpha/beta fold hydrolase n=1 Tax=unclassified Bradyrhizobium TaxID=2631580 RepID=UPI001BAD62BA|nr:MULTISPECIES: alpha/beta hydrolase [unclassified Bradyrhizobium]MBR1218810.1 alpha/beta hydrolase [Bradyrhizobium sp. U87765 SZCCT0131]MBR1261461.1 alpha/beta hydrolase [Bradyrhizobium sp. U87765 SZCCT0134]MBR1306686.1 alpha/beta hydrolase [Bradyrhizobium sp. U87765 SZCCT0110]MBR1317243.1 alpha/beta hydrolase [Bradyrhizobium sp. U87765 SZCCT0109]MBR1350945.1 alpha/beta hydrolase [Bradyrhizobium sp. U87765 SZCCT0048]
MTTWISATCEANGIRIHYLRTGGDKPPLVALHGLTGGGACWTPLARALARDYDVVMPDARGHGLSDTPPQGYRYGDHAADVAGLIAALGLQAPVLLGHSMGGMTAAVVARDAGAALSGLVLVDPTFLDPARQREVFESDAAAQHRRFLGMGRAEALADARLRHPHRSAEMIEWIVDARLRTPVATFDVLTPPNPDYRNLIAAIAAPILLVIGEHGVVSGATARELEALNPRLRSACIADVGHGLPHDKPDALAAIVGDFLRSLIAG